MTQSNNDNLESAGIEIIGENAVLGTAENVAKITLEAEILAVILEWLGYRGKTFDAIAVAPVFQDTIFQHRQRIYLN
jgi:hypothetical protein